MIAIRSPTQDRKLAQRTSTLFWITRNIWQGPFASQKRLDALRQNRITHIVNVGESPNQLTESDGPFTRIIWQPIEDLVRIPTIEAVECLNALHECVCDTDSNVYVHCVAGWNRSPTILWLYLVASGVDPNLAKNMIASTAYDAVPAHPKLIDDALVREVMKHGESNFMPHPRPNALDTPTVGEIR